MDEEIADEMLNGPLFPKTMRLAERHGVRSHAESLAYLSHNLARMEVEDQAQANPAPAEPLQIPDFKQT